MNPATINPLELPSVPLSARGHLPECPAVYFILDGAKVLYVGKSVNLSQRWVAHHRLKQVQQTASYPRIAWMELGDTALLDEIEDALIRHFEPSLNDRVIPDGLRAKAIKRVNMSLPDPVYEDLKRWAEHRDQAVAAVAAIAVERAIRDAKAAGELPSEGTK